MSMVSGELKKKFDQIIARYPADQKQAATIPLLHLLHAQEGIVSTEVEQTVADYLEIPITRVHEVTTFYTMFSQKPRGKNHMLVCRTLSCALNGSDAVCQSIKDSCGVGPNEVSADGKVSWESAECLAQCGTGPIIQIGAKVYTQQTPESARKLIEELRK